ncbi:MAG TPA: transcription termination factor Rho [Planctomycetes bacterium]|nr:transcription termination factor Rho [Planctomycetota bacterium]
MAPKKTTTSASDPQPFGAGAVEAESSPAKPKRSRRSSAKKAAANAEAPEQKEAGKDRRGAAKKMDGTEKDGKAAATRDPERSDAAGEGRSGGEGRQETARQAKRRRWKERRGRRRRKGGEGGDNKPRQKQNKPQGERGSEGTAAEAREMEGLLFIEKANHGHLRLAENSYLPTKRDVHVAPRLVAKYGLREGSMVKGPVRRGQGRHKWDLVDVVTVDGKDPKEVRNLRAFKQLTSIDPDFHYAVGDISGETSLKVMDLLCPVGRGQRGLIVAPPRSGKTILLQQFAKAIEKGYPEVRLIVLLVDERPEEATEWKRTIEKGDVLVSTNDEMPKKHVELAEAVWRRCKRLVELGEDVILLLDSITRLGRAYNNVKGDSGRTMSGGLDTRALERPKQFFGAARNTETAGSLTILGTTLVETGSRMDQVIFEEFKGTGNMELVLSRKLADRRIFPAIDIMKTGTRKEEKLHSSRRLLRVNTLRRVLTRMHWAEAMELLTAKLDDVERIDDFLDRFEIDPEA